MANVWEAIKNIFYRMPERCDPYIYFERVRPYIHGWKDNPALPEGSMKVLKNMKVAHRLSEGRLDHNPQSYLPWMPYWVLVTQQIH